MGPAHLAVGLAAKRVAPKAPLGVMLLATEVNDILWYTFSFTGIDRMGHGPWSHSLFMSATWSAIAALLAGRIFRSKRTGAVIGLLVFSHWVLDFISHPMWPETEPDLPLFFAGSPKVGLGLYRSLGVALTVETGLLILGGVVYMRARTTTLRKRQGV